MIFARTERLALRALERAELPRLVELIGVWDVVRWLAPVPFPYRLKHAEEFFAQISSAHEPEFFALATPDNNLLLGGVGLHPPRTPDAALGEVEFGYWLGRDFWGQGLMTEAARPVMQLAFARATTTALVATTGVDNAASQAVLRKMGFTSCGVVPCLYPNLRGWATVASWRLTRAAYEQSEAA